MQTEIKLTVNKRLKDLLPPLTKEEYEQLEANILADGVVRDPILFWENGTDENYIVDGMNRYAIATKHNIPFLTVSKDFDSIDAAELWMLDNALGRRNLTSPQSQRKIRGEIYNRMKGERGGDHTSQEAKCQNDTLLNAAQIVAEKAQVSEATVKRDGKYVAALDSLPKSIRESIGFGKCKATDAEVLQLAKADQSKQIEVARNVRTGTAKLGDAMAAAGVKRTVPNGKPRAKQGTPVVSGAKLVDQLTRAHVGNMVRGIDAIAKANGGKGPVHKQANDSLETLIKCLKRMRAGEK